MATLQLTIPIDTLTSLPLDSPAKISATQGIKLDWTAIVPQATGIALRRILGMEAERIAYTETRSHLQKDRDRVSVQIRIDSMAKFSHTVKVVNKK